MSQTEPREQEEVSRKRLFIEQYVLNAALGAGNRALKVQAAVDEAISAWDYMEKEVT